MDIPHRAISTMADRGKSVTCLLEVMAIFQSNQAGGFSDNDKARAREFIDVIKSHSPITQINLSVFEYANKSGKFGESHFHGSCESLFSEFINSVETGTMDYVDSVMDLECEEVDQQKYSCMENSLIINMPVRAVNAFLQYAGLLIDTKPSPGALAEFFMFCEYLSGELLYGGSRLNFTLDSWEETIEMLEDQDETKSFSISVTDAEFDIYCTTTYEGNIRDCMYGEVILNNGPAIDFVRTLLRMNQDLTLTSY